MKKLFVILVYSIFWLEHYAQSPEITIQTAPGNQYTGKLIQVDIKAKNLHRNHIHTVSIYNGIRDTTFQYSSLILEKSSLLEAGLANKPGLYFFQVDTINNITTKPPPYARAVLNRYALFLHTTEDTAVLCRNQDHRLLLSVVPNAVLTDSVHQLLDTLILKSNPDTLNKKMDLIYFQQPGDPAAHLCDSVKGNAILMSLIISRRPDPIQPWTSVTVVLDSLPPGVAEAAIKRTVDSFANKLLDSLPTALDTTTLTRQQKKAIRNELDNIFDPLHKRYQLIYSKCFARRMYMIHARLDINYVCQKYMVYRTTGGFNQLVFVMKVPL